MRERERKGREEGWREGRKGREGCVCCEGWRGGREGKGCVCLLA